MVITTQGCHMQTTKSGCHEKTSKPESNNETRVPQVNDKPDGHMKNGIENLSEDGYLEHK